MILAFCFDQVSLLRSDLRLIVSGSWYNHEDWSTIVHSRDTDLMLLELVVLLMLHLDKGLVPIESGILAKRLKYKSNTISAIKLTSSISPTYYGIFLSNPHSE